VSEGAVVSQIRAVEDLRGPAGRLEGLLNGGRPEARFSALVCHPHPAGGGTMHNKVVYNAMKVFSTLGLPVLRFNFRGVGRSEGEHAEGVGERQDVLAAVAWLAAEFGRPTLVAGFSFGAAVSLKACCGDPRVPGIAALGLPVEAAGREYRYPFLGGCRTPKLFVSGDSDQYAPRAALEEVFANAAQPKQVVFVPGAEHFFQGTDAAPGAKLVQMQAALQGWLSDVFGLD
jgi:alpha/beta superfamily hydrolase